MQQVEKRILNDTKTEREMKIRVETRLANYSKERELTLDLYTSGRITLDQYDKKVQLIEQNRLNDEEELLSMSNINTQLSISLKTLVNLVSHANQIFESSNFDEKRKFLKILFSNFILDGKNPVFSIRKPVLTLVKTGSRPKWQTKLYDLRKKYHDELAEMHLIIECMDDDLRQMIMAKKG